MTALVTLITPKRGQVDATTLYPNPLPDKEQTLFLQVERTRDQVSGMRLGEYWIAYEMQFDAVNTGLCTAAGGTGGGAGLTVSFPEIPAKCRVLDGFVEIPTALVNDAGTQDIDQVLLGATEVIADASIAANIATLVGFAAAGVKLLLTANTTPKVCLAGADTVLYNAGKLRLFIKVLGWFEA